MTDEIDRQIMAALISNGRAPFRQIAEVLGQQERTVSRRANKLLASGLVRVQSYPNPTALAPVDLYLLRVRAQPAELDAVASWLAKRSETHWISSLAGSSECVVEMFLEPAQINEFLYGQLAHLAGVRDFSLEPIFEYYQTVSGWRPDVLSTHQHEQLAQLESPSHITRRSAPGSGILDDSKRALIDLLRSNGRATLEEIATGLGVSKTTASRRLETLTNEGIIFLRAILDPATIGYPVEAMLIVSTESQMLDHLGQHLSTLPSTRWAANVAEKLVVQGAFRSLAELQEVMREISALDSVQGIDLSLYSRIYKRSTVVYEDGQLPGL